MFLSATRARNRPLIDAAFGLHAAGVLPPDTYVLDLDAVDANAAALAEAGRRHGVQLWYVVKQVGRNPEVIRTVGRHLPRAAAIDVREAGALDRAGAALGNVGHLVQIPVRDLPWVLSRRPTAVTVYDRDNLAAVAAEAARQGIVQDVLLRIEGDPATVYPGQEGGIPVAAVPELLRTAASLPGIRVAGVTGFPCLLTTADHEPEPTPTLHRVLRAADLLRAHGIADPVVDLPSGTSADSIPRLADWGATHAEPGHALTGTTPRHAVDHTLPELPALVYLTEIAHRGPERVTVFGGGFYPRGHVRSALVRTATGELETGVRPAPPENIDYYRTLGLRSDDRDRVRVGDPVVMAFRTQIFVTRSVLAVVSGVAGGAPRLVGLYDSAGRPVDPEELRPAAGGAR